MTDFEKALEQPRRLYINGDIDEGEMTDILYSEMQKAWKRSFSQAWNLPDAAYLYRLDTGFEITVSRADGRKPIVWAYATNEQIHNYWSDLNYERRCNE